MTEFRPFLQWTYPYEVLQERARIVQDLAQFVLRGIQSQFGPPYDHSTTKPFMDDLQSRMFDSFQSLMSKRPKSIKGIEGDTTELVIEAFRRAKNLNSDAFVMVTPPFSSAALRDAFKAKFNAMPLEYKESKPTVLDALTLAYQNLYLTETRLTTLTAIHVLLCQSEFQNVNDLAKTSEVRAELYNRLNSQYLYVMLLAGLEGGQHVAAATKLLARQFCYKEDPEDIQYSVMHLLQPDNNHPGRYLSETEQKFRDNIRKKYEALRG